MKVFISFTFVALLLPFSAIALQCYDCDTEDLKKCKEGKLDDKLLETCDAFNSIVNPLLTGGKLLSKKETEDFISAQQGGNFGCGKGQGKLTGYGDGTLKSCIYSRENATDGCEKYSEGPDKVTLCICHSDKCNGGSDIKLGAITFISAFFTIFITILK